MKTTAIALLGFFWLSAATQAADRCTKECAEFLKVCRQAHSKEACQTDFNICTKHCQQK